jgi:hypothetical protein
MPLKVDKGLNDEVVDIKRDEVVDIKQARWSNGYQAIRRYVYFSKVDY